MKKALITVLKITAFFVGWAVYTAIDVPAEDPAVWRFFAELVPLVSMILFTVAFILIEKKKIRKKESLPSKYVPLFQFYREKLYFRVVFII